MPQGVAICNVAVSALAAPTTTARLYWPSSHLFPIPLKQHSLGTGVGLVTQVKRFGLLVAVQTHSGQKLLENLFSYIQGDAKVMLKD